MNLILPASIDHDLHWGPILEKARSCKAALHWIFDFGWKTMPISLEEEMFFHAFQLALNKFREEVFPEFPERTAQVTLYRGSLDFTTGYVWSDVQERNWQEWKEGSPRVNEVQMRRLFCAKSYAAYFQMLSQSLPDEIIPTLEFTRDFSMTCAEREQLFSREIFPHFQLKGDWEKESTIAVLFPEEKFCSEAMLHRLDSLFAKLEQPFRVIHEPFLTEEWEGVDRLVVFSDALGQEGLRKLKGFNAAGGIVVTIGEKLPLSLQITWN